jgi:predicted XRE-type DNA-binding protein
MPRRDPIPDLKQQLAEAIVERLDGWIQPMAAELIRTDQPRISDLRRGRLERFSLEQLLRFASRLRGTVSIEITWPGLRPIGSTDDTAR